MSIRKRKKKIDPNNIPPELVDMLNKLDQARKANPNVNPYELYWDLIKERYVKGGEENGKGTIDTGTGTGDIQENGAGQKPTGLSSLDDNRDVKTKESPKRSGRRIQHIE